MAESEEREEREELLLVIEKKKDILIKNKVYVNSIIDLIVTGFHFEKMGSISIEDYWVDEKFTMRDEFFIIFNAYLNLGILIGENKHNTDWKEDFEIAYLFQNKSNIQSALSINILTKNNCYADALSICRTLISRTNLLLLSALNPNLFDVWLKNPKSEIFLDGHIRKELENNGIRTIPHLYEFASEIIHSQAEGLSDIGYFENGLFPQLLPIENQIWVTVKFVFAISYYSMICMTLEDFKGKQIPEKLKYHVELFDSLLKNILVYNRVEHMQTFIAEDRHWEKVGKVKKNIGGFFDFPGFREQIEKFHRKAQPKTLSKKYNI